MLALEYRGTCHMTHVQRPDPLPAPHEVRVRIMASGICGSDLHGYLGLTGRRTPPMVMGHEFAGLVDRTGSQVVDIRPGDRVAGFPLLSCGQCPDCQAGREHRCARRRFMGAMDQDGAMADFVCLPATHALHLPDRLTYAAGAMAEPLAVAVRACSQAGSLHGRTVMIVGSGTIGLLLLQVVRLQKPAAILVSDLNDERLSMARQLGADATFNPGKMDLEAAAATVFGPDGCDVAFEAVGLGATVAQAMQVLHPGGLCVWVGNSQRQITLDMQQVVTRELKISGTYIYTRQQFQEAIGLLAGGEVTAEPLISHRLPLSEGVRVFQAMASDPGSFLKVILEPYQGGVV